MYESGNQLFEIVHYGNRELVIKPAQVGLKIDFPQSILGLTGPDLTTNKTKKRFDNSYKFHAKVNF